MKPTFPNVEITKLMTIIIALCTAFTVICKNTIPYKWLLNAPIRKREPSKQK